MALNIKDAATDRLARRLAAETGESITVATRRALEERLARIGRSRPGGRDELLHEIVARGRQRPVLDDRGADEILGYDEDGLPG